MSAPSDLEVHPEDLQQIVDVLDSTGKSLFGRAPDLDQRPDAGASSGEIAKALGALSGAVAGIAEHIGSIAASAAGTGADFSGTDQAVSGAMRQRQGVLGP
jgi:hypothetical protein